MPPPGFEPRIPASERPHTHPLDRAAIGTGYNRFPVCLKLTPRSFSMKPPTATLEVGLRVKRQANYVEILKPLTAKGQCMRDFSARSGVETDLLRGTGFLLFVTLHPSHILIFISLAVAAIQYSRFTASSNKAPSAPPPPSSHSEA